MPTYYYGLTFPEEGHLKITEGISNYIDEEGIGLVGIGDINTISYVKSEGGRKYWFFSVTMNPILKSGEKLKLRKGHTHKEYCEAVYKLKRGKLERKLDGTVDSIDGEWWEFSLNEVLLEHYKSRGKS